MSGLTHAMQGFPNSSTGKGGGGGGIGRIFLPGSESLRGDFDDLNLFQS